MTIEAKSGEQKMVTPGQTDSPVLAKNGVSAWKEALAKDRQQHWQKIFQSGEYNLYDRERKPIKWDAFRDACYQSITDPGEFFKHFGEHVRKIDYEFRGEKDAGDAKERMERIGVLSGVIVLFTVFDYVSSKPFNRLIPIKPKFDKIGNKIDLSSDDLRFNARGEAIKKLIDVMNDKYATALGNMLVEKLSGKRGFIHEVADKGADTLQEGFGGLQDYVNGATLESYMRIISQIPIAGALFEQGVTRLAGLQEKSPVHTATGKMIYMALGVFIKNSRAAAGKERAINQTDIVELAARMM